MLCGRLIDICTCAPSSAHPTLITTLNLSKEKLAKESEKTQDWYWQAPEWCRIHWYVSYLTVGHCITGFCFSFSLFLLLTRYHRGGEVKDNLWVQHICHNVVALFFKFSNFPPAISKQQLFHSDFLAGFFEVDKPWTIHSLKNAEGAKPVCMGLVWKRFQ